jgi:hypothetical protein
VILPPRRPASSRREPDGRGRVPVAPAVDGSARRSGQGQLLLKPAKGCRIEANGRLLRAVRDAAPGLEEHRRRTRDAGQARVAVRERGEVKKLNCQDVLDQLSEYLEADVAAELRSQIEVHLNGCRHCLLEVDTLRTTIQLFRVDDPVGIPIHLSERLTTALQAAYREKGCE